MKTVITCLVLFGGMAAAQIFAPVGFPDDIITYYADVDSLAVQGIPVVGEPTGVSYISWSYSKSVTGAEIKGDSLIVTTMPGVIYYKQAAPILWAPNVTFGHRGIYGVYEYDASIDCYGCPPAYWGDVRVLPAPVTDPDAPVTTVPVMLQLVTELSHSACSPVYTNIKAQVKGLDVFFSFTEEPYAGGCVDIYLDPAVPYGPSVDLGMLEAGMYTVYIDDTIKTGSFSVEDPRPVAGNVIKMKHPYVKMPDVPLVGVAITAEAYEPCVWYLDYAAEATACSTVSGSDGAFSLELPRKNSDYELTATLKGYHPQKLYIRAADSSLHDLSYMLIPETDDSLADIAVSVTDNGVPVESVYVSVQAGPGLVICPMLVQKSAAVYVGTYTDDAGQCVLKDVAVVPYLDYQWSAYKYGTATLRADGETRLYQAVGWENTLAIDFNTQGVADPVPVRPRPGFSLSPNPASGPVTVRMWNVTTQPRITLFAQDGSFIRTVRTAQIVTAGLDAGVYLVRLDTGGDTVVRKLFVRP